MTPDFMGTLPGWITAASTTTGVTTLIIAWWRRGIQLRGLDDKRETALQEHMDGELDRMQTVIDGLRRRLDERDKERNQERREHDRERAEWEKRWREAQDYHDECVRERADLRREVEGLKRQVAEKSADRLMILEGNNEGQKPSNVAPEAAASAPRVKKIIDGNGNEK